MSLKKISYIFFSIIISIFLIITTNSNVIAHSNLSKNNSNLLEIVPFDKFIAQQNLDKVEIITIPVKDNLYMLMGEGGNIGVSVGEDGNLLIDSQFAPLTTKINQAITKINQQPIRYLINTHYHFDHTDGNENFANLGAVIVAHKNVPKQMSIAHSYPILGMKKSPSPASALPVITFEDNFNLDFNNSKIQAISISKAHTDGDIFIYFEEQNVIHAGDLFFNGFYPFIDTEVGGSVEGMIKGIDQILTLCDNETLIIPGHGKLSNTDGLIRFQNMLKIVDQRVKEGVTKNMNLDALIKANILKDLDKEWGQGFLNSEQFITLAYQGLKNN